MDVFNILGIIFVIVVALLCLAEIITSIIIDYKNKK